MDKLTFQVGVTPEIVVHRKTNIEELQNAIDKIKKANADYIYINTYSKAITLEGYKEIEESDEEYRKRIEKESNMSKLDMERKIERLIATKEAIQELESLDPDSKEYKQLLNELFEEEY